MTGEVSGIDLDAVGVILMVVGALGAVLSMIFWSSWGGPGYWGSRRRSYVEGPPPAASGLLERGLSTLADTS